MEWQRARCWRSSRWPAGDGGLRPVPRSASFDRQAAQGRAGPSPREHSPLNRSYPPPPRTMAIPVEHRPALAEPRTGSRSTSAAGCVEVRWCVVARTKAAEDLLGTSQKDHRYRRSTTSDVASPDPCVGSSLVAADWCSDGTTGGGRSIVPFHSHLRSAPCGCPNPTNWWRWRCSWTRDDGPVLLGSDDWREAMTSLTARHLPNGEGFGLPVTFLPLDRR